jgi:hypothetical protein
LLGLSYFRKCSRYLYELIESIEKIMNNKQHLVNNAEVRNVYDRTIKLKFFHQKNKKTTMTNNRSIELNNKELSDIEHF